MFRWSQYGRSTSTESSNRDDWLDTFKFLNIEQYVANHLRASESACAKSAIHLCGIY